MEIRKRRLLVLFKKRNSPAQGSFEKRLGNQRHTLHFLGRVGAGNESNPQAKHFRGKKRFVPIIGATTRFQSYGRGNFKTLGRRTFVHFKRYRNQRRYCFVEKIIPPRQRHCGEQMRQFCKKVVCKTKFEKETTKKQIAKLLNYANTVTNCRRVFS